MATKPKPARFTVGMVLAMALTILAVMTWADRDWAAPSSSSPIYHPQLPLLY
jgi:heme/copper-type cytochrome/quinol oxidase subunit 4